MGVAKRKLNPQELELVETYRKAGTSLGAVPFTEDFLPAPSVTADTGGVISISSSMPSSLVSSLPISFEVG